MTLRRNLTVDLGVSCRNKVVASHIAFCSKSSPPRKAADMAQNLEQDQKLSLTLEAHRTAHQESALLKKLEAFSTEARSTNLFSKSNKKCPDLHITGTSGHCSSTGHKRMLELTPLQVTAYAPRKLGSQAIMGITQGLHSKPPQNGGLV